MDRRQFSRAMAGAIGACRPRTGDAFLIASARRFAGTGKLPLINGLPTSRMASGDGTIRPTAGWWSRPCGLQRCRYGGPGLCSLPHGGGRPGGPGGSGGEHPGTAAGLGTGASPPFGGVPYRLGPGRGELRRSFGHPGGPGRGPHPPGSGDSPPASSGCRGFCERGGWEDRKPGHGREFRPEELELESASGFTIGEGIRRLGGDPERLAEARASPGEVAGFLELHVEQGAVLERSGHPDRGRGGDRGDPAVERRGPRMLRTMRDHPHGSATGCPPWCRPSGRGGESGRDLDSREARWPRWGGSRPAPGHPM